MPHYLVKQLRFSRSELVRCLEGVSAADAQRRLDPMNCISWIVGHLADQENRYWVQMAQGTTLALHLSELVGYGNPPSTPPLADMWETWRAVTTTADEYLDTITSEQLETRLKWRGNPVSENVGTLLFRNIHHYWFHIGEAHAIRQMLGHPDLPQFVGSMAQAGYYTASENR